MTIEERFWAKVWRCEHRHPCHRCCWPWRKIDLTVNWRHVWEQHATFAYSEAGRTWSKPAHRCAYELTHGLLLFTGKSFHLCHQCQFGPCCNYVHLLPGSVTDNARDRRALRCRPRIIRLPDGRQWDYATACAAQDAFDEARGFQRVFAGPIHPHFNGAACSLNFPHPLLLPWKFRHATTPSRPR